MTDVTPVRMTGVTPVTKTKSIRQIFYAYSYLTYAYSYLTFVDVSLLQPFGLSSFLVFEILIGK
jgi:hypothetical protein